jgi:hypothetical protein
MNDELKKAQEEARLKLEARVNELVAFSGKYFVKKGDEKKRIIKVVGYAGVKVKDGESAHTFQVESKDARWTPKATQFLEEHEQVEGKAEKETINEVK